MYTLSKQRNSPPMTPCTYPNEDHWPRVLTAINQPMAIEPVRAWLEVGSMEFLSILKTNTHGNDRRKNSRVSPSLILFRFLNQQSNHDKDCAHLFSVQWANARPIHSWTRRLLRIPGQMQRWLLFYSENGINQRLTTHLFREPHLAQNPPVPCSILTKTCIVPR